MVKVKLEHGSSKITLEGEYDEVKEILDSHWSPMLEKNSSSTIVDDRQAVETVQTSSGNKRSKPRRTAVAKPKTGTSSEQNNVRSVKNAINSHEKFESVIKPIIYDGTPIDRIKLVAFFVDGKTNNVFVKAVGSAFKVKWAASSLSNAYAKNQSEFLDEGKEGKTQVYQLNAPARELFGKRLLGETNE